MYTSERFLCLQRLIDHVGLNNDPSGWSISTLSTSFCRNRVGIIDAMSVEKIYSKSYDWVAAEAQSNNAIKSAIERMPNLTKADPIAVLGKLMPPASNSEHGGGGGGHRGRPPDHARERRW